MVSRTRLDECENREDAEERWDDRDPGSHPGSHQAPLPLPNNGKEDIMDDQGVRYSRLTKADRRAIEAGLTARGMPRDRTLGTLPNQSHLRKMPKQPPDGRKTHLVDDLDANTQIHGYRTTL